MKDKTAQLMTKWQMKDLLFIAKFNKIDENHGYFIDFINPTTRIKVLYPNLDSVNVEDNRISFYWGKVEENNCYYKIELRYTNNPKGKKNPYSLEIKSAIFLDQEKIKEYLYNKNQSIGSAKEHIRKRFERLDNPEANKMIANLMREIGKGMYSSKQRMIFELLQNADDAPGKTKVEFHIDTKSDYLFIMHDGIQFCIEDVDAITSAAESTKRGDKKKTGYKGIGFKSVFTDSSEVWIKSGVYQFAFIRNSEFFKDFDSFYFTLNSQAKNLHI